MDLVFIDEASEFSVCNELQRLRLFLSNESNKLPDIPRVDILHAFDPVALQIQELEELQVGVELVLELGGNVDPHLAI